jgi:hypothetical protein
MKVNINMHRKYTDRLYKLFSLPITSRVSHMRGITLVAGEIKLLSNRLPNHDAKYSRISSVRKIIYTIKK